MNKQHKTYGLITAIAMIVGIVIGSGIYFKADDILAFTGGNTWLGALVLTIGASNIIFGSLALSEFAKRETTGGGLAAYFERFVSPALAAGFGWFQTFFFIPSVTAIVAWAAGIYTGILFNWNLSFGQQVLVGAGYTMLFSALNILAKHLAGYFQSITTIIKLIPLLLIGIAALFWGNPQPGLPADVVAVPLRDVGLGWLSALVPLAFAYEGWNFVVSIAPELKNPKRDLSRALIIGPSVILIAYLAFFLGMVKILGAEFIMSTGDKAITYTLSALLGEKIASLVLVVVIISILGVLNGMLLTGFRLPHALANKGMLPGKQFMQLHPRYEINLASCLLFCGITLLWLGAHYITQTTGLFRNIDVSEVSIVFSYLCYIPLYVVCLKAYHRGQFKNKLTAFIAPILAIGGSLLIVGGSLITSFALTLCFLALCTCVVGAGYAYYQRTHK